LLHRWNSQPLGFAANHNQSMRTNQALHADWLLIANPDLDWRNPLTFEALLFSMRHANKDVGAISLMQVLPNGEPVEFARRLMTPWQLAKRVADRFFKRTSVYAHALHADWVNAACLAVRRETFQELGGFDERYQLYCEDIDFCLRLRMAGWKLAVLDRVIVHDTRRDSAKRWKYLLWHLSSLLKLWKSKAFWQFLWWRTKQGDSIVELRHEILSNIASNQHAPTQSKTNMH
jgi:N-acetylglucosaminyl-diphospho-decaprenol L-rhamnosyltransferase